MVTTASMTVSFVEPKGCRTVSQRSFESIRIIGGRDESDEFTQIAKFS